jgi:excisionase family DNA binding protein
MAIRGLTTIAGVEEDCMQDGRMAERLFSMYQVANLLGVTSSEVAMWIQKGWIITHRLGDGQIRIAERELVQFLRQKGIDLGAILARMSPADAPDKPSAPATSSTPRPAMPPASREPIEPATVPASQAKPVIPPAEIPLDEGDDGNGKGDHETAYVPEEIINEVKTPAPVPIMAGEEPSESILMPAQPPSEAPRADDFATATEVQLLAAILRDAVARGATHVHLDLRGDGLSMGMRIDGLLRPRASFQANLPRPLAPRLMAHLKKHSGITESSRPQSSKLVNPLDTETQLDVAWAATTGGETFVISLPSRSGRILALDELGLAPADAIALHKVCRQEAGLLVVAGPAVSGRSTTLAAMSGEIASFGRNLLCIVDTKARALQKAPGRTIRVDDDASGVQVLQTAIALDADAVVLDRIRGGESLRAAAELAQNGVLVLAALHANSTIETMALIQEVIPDRWALAENLLAVVQQRLVRRLCPQCRRPASADAVSLRLLGLSAAEFQNIGMQGQGCDHCDLTGYAGRGGIFSTRIFGSAMSDAIRKGASLVDVLPASEENGVKSLLTCGLDRVRDGQTSMQELARVLPTF